VQTFVYCKLQLKPWNMVRRQTVRLTETLRMKYTKYNEYIAHCVKLPQLPTLTLISGWLKNGSKLPSVISLSVSSPSEPNYVQHSAYHRCLV